MSLTKNHSFEEWKSIESQIRRHIQTCQGVQLDQKESEKAADVKLLTLMIWCDNAQALRKSLSRIVPLVGSLDIFDFIHFLSQIDEKLLALIEHDVRCDYETFKQSLRQECDFYCGPILGALKELIAAWLEKSDYVSFSKLRTCLLFPSRLNLRIDSLAEKALQDYLETEASLQTSGFTIEEKSLLERWFPRRYRSMLFSDLDPKHGNGAVADCKRNLAEKYQHIGTDALIRYQNCQAGYTPPEFGTCSFERVSKLMFVPKSYKSYRSISEEPATLMWYQQGFKRNLDKYLARSSCCPIRYHYDSEHPEFNRDLAQCGSEWGTMCTIDLHAASDSVTWSLVQSWFHDTCLYPMFVTTRSRETLLPSGDRLTLKKFAPMGSALNFPVEVIVFSAIVECAIRACGGDPTVSDYRVYGDDIVVEKEYVTAVMQRLTQNGFVVNHEKSFFRDGQHTFRESCGGHYVDGYDVTPFRISRKFEGLKPSCHHPSQIQNLIELANGLADISSTARLRVVHSLLGLPKAVRPPFSEDPDLGIYSVAPTNYHLRRLSPDNDRRASELQEELVTFGRIAEVHDDPTEETEAIRLYEYLRRSDGRQRLLYPEDAVDVSVTPSHLKWIRVTLPMWCLTAKTPSSNEDLSLSAQRSGR